MYIKYIHKTFYSSEWKKYAFVGLFFYTNFIIGDCEAPRYVNAIIKLKK